jgi:hypothetical protein
MKNLTAVGTIAVLLVAAAGIASASTITYSVSKTAGLDSVTGTITTDGALGTLSYGNIVNWDLTITDDDSGSYTLTGPTSGDDSELGFSGSDLTATSTDLAFDFSGNDGGYMFFEPPPIIGRDFVCFAANTNYCNDSNSIVIVLAQDTQQFTLESGDEIIATAATPEPLSFLLLASGLALTFLARKTSALSIIRR